MKKAVVMAAILFLFLVAVSFPPRLVRSDGQPSSQTPRQMNRDTPAGESRVALVIGNGAYAKGRLKNPPNDARAMAAALREVGFEATEVIDADKVKIQRAIRDFGKRLKETAGVGLFYYAGHGVQVGGHNYLVPLGAETEVEKEEDVELYCLDAENVLRQMEGAGGRINIVILDACRTNPFSRSFSRDGGGGLAEIKAPSGTLIAYATDPGRTASDGDGVNGLYTQELLARIRQPGLRIEDVFNLAGAEVERKSGKRQQPWISSKLRGAFYFRPSGGTANVNPGSADSGAAEREAWETVKDSSDPEDFREFLKLFPNGRYAATARLKMGKPGTTGKPSGRPTTARPAAFAPGTQKMTGAGIEVVFIPAGEFQMGSPETELSRADDEVRHRVVISEPFWMGKYEVTQAQWQIVMGTNPSSFKNCLQCPVEQISWNDCQSFIEKMNQRNDGFVYALPTEAQWEYACRAGTTTPFSFGATINPRQSNYNGEYPYGKSPKALFRGQTVPVGSLEHPNRWGLYDMHGNVSEWCSDWYGDDFYLNSPVNDPEGPKIGTSRVVRGGSWESFANQCRSACRSGNGSRGRNFGVGFRLVARSLKE